jgi:hypothetical protein
MNSILLVGLLQQKDCCFFPIAVNENLLTNGEVSIEIPIFSRGEPERKQMKGLTLI